MAFMPVFKGAIEGYVVNYLKKHLWRIARTHDFKDAMQEAYKVFLVCAGRYTGVTEPAHFMSLFKTTWEHEFTDLSNLATAAKASSLDVPYEEEGEGGFSIDRLAAMAGDLENDGQLAVMIDQAPQDVQLVLMLFLRAPQELLELALATWRASGHYRPDGDKSVSRMLGLPPGSTPMTNTINYFSKE
jgi:hypothetical protein